MDEIPKSWPRRAAVLAAPIAVGLLIYWRLPFLWFQNDDFGWLSLGGDLRRNGLLHALFTPFAQGTVRVLGDRVYFLVLSELFGPHALPFRLCELATWASALILAALIGEKLTGSSNAGLMAALLWAANATAVSSVAWASAYDQLLCAVCLLGAFYSRLRGWRAAEWILYLAGFGALEITVMYPFLVLTYILLTNRKELRGALWLFVPATAFAVVHFLFIPKPPGGPYALAIDSRLPSTIAAYFAWAFEPGSSALRTRAAQLRGPELILGTLLGLALAWFTIRCLARRERIAIFFCAWFGALLAPVLLLPGHLTPYYLTLPSVGLAWLAGWGIAHAWANGVFARLVAAALALAYFVPSVAGIESQTRWFRERSDRMREVIQAVSTIEAAHPGTAIALEGVDDELLQAGFDVNPFPVFRVEHVSRFPGEISAADLQAGVAENEIRVLEVHGNAVADVTDRFR